ncbi:MAG: DUF1800 family protein [Bacteroidota bacterium]
MASISPQTGNLTRSQAAHLLRRATFGPSKATLDGYSGMDVDQAVESLFQAQPPAPAPPIDPSTGTTFHEREELGGGTMPFVLQAYMKIWWVNNMLGSGDSALEKIVFFLHSHFTNSANKINLAFPLYHQNALFRHYAYGSFKTLAKKVCRDYAMSVYLDGYTNYFTSPNENFAREFLELYTIGKGPQIGPGNYTTYTEDDVQAAARVLTGYFPSGYLEDAQIPPEIPIQIDSDTGLYMSSVYPVIHDPFPKVFSSAFQNTIITSGSNTIPEIENELDALVNMIFNQQATAEYICRKLYRFFVYYDITQEIEDDIIQPMTTTFINSNFELVPVLKQLLKSQHFYDTDDAQTTNNRKGAIIKSPIDFLLGASRFFDVPLPPQSDIVLHYNAVYVYALYSEYMDMELFESPEVAGWPAYFQEPFFNRNWINGTTLVNRFGSMENLVRGIDVVGGLYNLRLDILDYVATPGNITTPADPNVVVEELTNDLFPYGADDDKKAALKTILTDGDIDAYWTQTWIDYLGGGNELTARLRLEALIDAILQSPEYQLL